MTLNTKGLLAVADQLSLEISAVGVVTTDTGHILTVTGVYNLITHRVAEFPLRFMALTAYYVAVSLQQRLFITAVHRMALVTSIIKARMNMCFIFIPCKGVFMTTAADLPFFCFQQTGIITGMGGMAMYAAVPRTGSQVVMDTCYLFTYLRMTA